MRIFTLLLVVIGLLASCASITSNRRVELSEPQAFILRGVDTLEDGNMVLTADMCGTSVKISCITSICPYEEADTGKVFFDYLVMGLMNDSLIAEYEKEFDLELSAKQKRVFQVRYHLDSVLVQSDFDDFQFMYRVDEARYSGLVFDIDCTTFIVKDIGYWPLDCE
ncbi:MAG: hypothetical protein HWD92_09365 [Flavobacteriia bacterium]|nr:hypothetical protein [Flavobacteriia bacterium]